MEGFATTEGVSELLRRIHGKGVRIWTDNGLLRYQSPKDALTPADIDTLRALKDDIVEYLQGCSGPDATEPPLVPRFSSELLPLTFAQQWEWNRWGPGRRRFRTVCTATQLSGRLSVDTLRECVQEMTCRHDSLRTRVVMMDGIVRQIVDEHSPGELEVIDLTGQSEASRDEAARDCIKQLIEEPIEPSVGPLFEAKLLKLTDSEHVLVTAADHLVSDGVATVVMLQDIFELYSHSLRRNNRSPREGRCVQPGDYALWQHRVTASWNMKHGRYWDRRLSGARRVRVFPNEAVMPRAFSRLAIQSTQLGQALSEEIRERSRLEKTTLAMSLLSVYTALIARFCDITDVVIPFITVGRDRAELNQVVGHFVYPLFLRMELNANDSFSDLLSRATQEYGAALEHRDAGRIAARNPPPAFRQNPEFNWMPRELDARSGTLMDRLGSLDLPIQLRPYTVKFETEGIEWNVDELREPVLFLSDSQEGVAGGIGYLESCVSLSTIENFESAFRMLAATLARNPDRRIASVM